MMIKWGWFRIAILWHCIYLFQVYKATGEEFLKIAGGERFIKSLYIWNEFRETISLESTQVFLSKSPSVIPRCVCMRVFFLVWKWKALCQSLPVADSCWSGREGNSTLLPSCPPLCPGQKHRALPSGRKMGQLPLKSLTHRRCKRPVARLDIITPACVHASAESF